MTGTRRFQAEKKLKARGEKKYSLMDWNSACPREDGKYLSKKCVSKDKRQGPGYCVTKSPKCGPQTPGRFLTPLQGVTKSKLF